MVFAHDSEYKTETIEGILKEPTLYRVNLLNDDFTPMEFVVMVLERIFGMDRTKASTIALEAHIKGKAGCGIYTKDIAETKIVLATEYAEQHDHPLKYSLEAV